ESAKHLRIPPSPTVWACGFSRGSVKSRYAAYYFDVSFEETVRRHAMRQPTEFSETDMKRWWLDQDHRPSDRLIAMDRSIESVVQMIKQEQMGESE
ncbi:hypothetical protein ACRPK8_15755, partial [Exiguobacterium sp. TDN 0502]